MSDNDQYFKSDCETATVVAIQERWVVVELDEKDACHACGAKMICRPNATGKRTLKILNTLQAKIGDRVLIEQIGANQLKLTTIQYGLPLLGFLTGVLIANYHIKSDFLGIPAELLQMACGVMMVIIIGFGIFLWSRKKAQSGFSIFRLRQVLGPEK
jgi:positive regulator of sigma E activity